MAIKKPEEPTYIRVGIDYFKIIKKPDRFGIIRTELKKWNKDTIMTDHGRKAIYDVKTFDDFVIEPNNNGNIQTIHNCFNMYHQFPHKPKKGEWKWTFVMLKHIFGTQFKMGMQYLKVLYEHPKQALPILVLVSEERQTGKSTFLDWLNMIFGANMAMIEPDVIGSTFNGEYATSNIIAIDETILDKQIAVEKIKSLATKKFISVNIKQVQQFKLPFFGKIILASNNEDKFMRIDDKEIRFWIRKLAMPKIENHNILNDMIDEIPAFLHYLTIMPDIDFTRSRMVFTKEQLKNDWLEKVVKESRSSLHKELIELFTDWFYTKEKEFVYARPIDIKNKWFMNNNQITISYIRRVIKYEMKKDTEIRTTYSTDCLDTDQINGMPFKFEASEFGVDIDDIDKLPF